jgi:putative hydrolase of the HAD superfamily
MRAAELDAVTLDALGTLIRLRDPVPALQAALRERGVERDPATVAAAFAREVEHYLPRCVEGRDAESLEALRVECAAVFLEAAAADIDPASFVDSFMGALQFEEEPGARAAVRRLAEAGLRLAVVSNWDATLPATLAELGLDAEVAAVVTSAEAGASKPEPAIFELALARLGTTPDRTLHIGDGDADEEGAARAGIAFLPTPLGAAVEGLL